MNGYERVVAALQLKEPDRVPVFEWMIDPNVIEGICPGSDLYDLVEQLDLDGVCVFHRDWYQRTVASKEDTTVVDMWGIRWAGTAEAYVPIDGPIKSEADLERYVPPDPYDDALMTGVVDLVERFKGKKFITYQSIADFMIASSLRGFPDFLVDLIDNPKLVHRLMEMGSDFYCTTARRAIEAGADGVMFGDDWAYNTGPFMSPSHFREFILPYFKRAVQAVKGAGGYVIKHTDGNIWSLIDMIVASGVDAINPIQPDAGMDIGEVKRKYGDRVCIIGNINCGYTLSDAPVEQVVREVKEAIGKAGPGGGYVMMSSNSLHSSVRPENYKAMVEATKTYGRYPLSL